MYTRLKGYARRYVAELPAPLKKYFLEYQRDFRRFREISSKRELLREIEKSDLIFCGDYHTLAQAQRTVIRLLRDTVDRIKSRKKEMILALEMVGPEHDLIIQNFLAGRIGEKELLKAIRFEARWGFAWENYRPLFLFAKEHGVRIIGLSGRSGRGPSLVTRDRFAAKILTREVATFRDASIFVLMGDMHLASSHLPALVSESLSRHKIRCRHTIVHQNHEGLYWKLAENGVTAEVLKLDTGIYCVLNTSPWIKLQSHVRWAECRAEGEDVFDVDEEVEELAGVLARFFRVPFRSAGDFTVLRLDELPLLVEIWRGKGHTSSQINRWIRLARESKSTYFAGEKIYVLRKPSFNQIASMASHYFHSKVSGAGSFHRGRQDFYPSVWYEAVGFFGSKLLNPNRKIGKPKDALSRETHLGRVLGDAIYKALMDGVVTAQEVRDLFRNPFRNSSAARHLYRQWIHRLDTAGYRQFRNSDL
jgi:hypothetical protein